MGTSYKFYYIEFINYKEAIQIFIYELIEVYSHIYCDINLFVWCGITCNTFNIFSQNIIKELFWSAIKVMAPGIMTYINNKGKNANTPLELWVSDQNPLNFYFSQFTP